tara:strand:- start:3424 stop:3666 length:243 start_codon:yes stop_codon:yes gene_type:complete
MCNLCKGGNTESRTSRIQRIPICNSCKKLEDKLCEIIETEELEKHISFSELIVYCDMLRNDMLSEDKDIPFNEYLSLMRD